MKVPFNINLSGKTAIVTGGSGTLCSAMAYGLAVCGAKVAIIGRNKEKLASVSEKLTKDALDEYNKNVTVKGYSCNVINKDELSAAYETIKNELGSCDILINGAGGNQPGAITSIEMLKKEKEDSDYSFWNLDEDRIRDVMDLNYMGTLPLTKVMAYGNAKSAILNLTQWLAVHFGESGIRCNAIAPGFYAAEQNHDLLFNADGTYTDRARKIIAGTPMGRFGNPEELIGAALFLASDETAGFVNGIVLPVDGGYSAYSGV